LIVILLSKFEDSKINQNPAFQWQIYNKIQILYYLIKIKGKVNIPDYAQLRDENFTLLAYFRVDRPEKALMRAGLEEQTANIKKLLDEIPFGKLHPVELK
jgi:hypothetical protein